MRFGKAPASRTARTPASKPQAKLPSTAADWIRRSAWAWDSAAATAGTAPSLRKESFLVRLPMIWFLTSLSALSFTSGSVEPSRTNKSDGARRWLDEAVAEVGMVRSPRRDGVQADAERLLDFLEFLITFFYFW
jgi:hypothetical protein